jgi:hypothetical protein
MMIATEFGLALEEELGANVATSWTAANFNKFVTAVISEIGKPSGVVPTLRSLIIAGHSRAYAILTLLAREFCQKTAATTTATEPLAKLTEVWAMDSTYSPLHVRALEAWASKVPKVRFSVLYSQRAAGGERFHWLNYFDVCPGFGPPSNLAMCVVPEEHCEIPMKYVGELLSATKHPRTGANPRHESDAQRTRFRMRASAQGEEAKSALIELGKTQGESIEVHECLCADCADPTT